VAEWLKLLTSGHKHDTIDVSLHPISDLRCQEYLTSTQVWDFLLSVCYKCPQFPDANKSGCHDTGGNFKIALNDNKYTNNP